MIYVLAFLFLLKLNQTLVNRYVIYFNLLNQFLGKFYYKYLIFSYFCVLF